MAIPEGLILQVDESVPLKFGRLSGLRPGFDLRFFHQRPVAPAVVGAEQSVIGSGVDRRRIGVRLINRIDVTRAHAVRRLTPGAAAVLADKQPAVCPVEDYSGVDPPALRLV